ncbi:hypothetical protein [Myxococcus sp. Y35]|uniref:hypothetical protein n=1 Tax=Pseudomyxococcus flavus TaxID=3115648 RepID=UPI003CE90EF2
MTDAYLPGAVWKFEKDFGDGKERLKYMVLLNDLSQPGSLSIAAITTSRGAQRYPPQTAACGCPEHPYFRIDPKQEACFPIATWVEFNNAHLLTRSKLDSIERDGQAKFLQRLAPDRIRAVLNCALKSRDMPLKNLEMVDRTLKGMNSPKAKPPPPLASPLSPMAKLKARFDSHGPECRNSFEGLVSRSTDELKSILAEKTPHPEGFMEDAGIAFGMIADQCKCPNAS